MFVWKEMVNSWQINISQPQGHMRISPSVGLFAISTKGFYSLGTNMTVLSVLIVSACFLIFL